MLKIIYLFRIQPILYRLLEVQFLNFWYDMVVGSKFN